MSEHQYLSTGCLHGDMVLPDGRTGHEYCQGDTGAAGAKVPSSCKFCGAPCQCDCHQVPRVVVEFPEDWTGEQQAEFRQRLRDEGWSGWLLDLDTPVRLVPARVRAPKGKKRRQR